MKLDESQMAFVNNEATNIRLLAPAGSGKTTTLLYRCKRLIDEHPEDKVLVFTFTRVACIELKYRLETCSEFANIKKKITISTLNAYGNKILKNKFPGYHKPLGNDKKEKRSLLEHYLRPVTCYSPIIDSNINDRKWFNKNYSGIIKVINGMKTLGFDHEKINVLSGFEAHCRYLLKNKLGIMVETLFKELEEMGFIEDKNRTVQDDSHNRYMQAYTNFVQFYVKATDILKRQHVFTIEDQKYWGWKVMQDGSKIFGIARYAHIMVDEFQDINPIDLYFINILRENHQASLTVVGDDDQTIFEWRGATPQYILAPEQYLTNNKEQLDFATAILTRNYRSPRNIVEISQKLISHNHERIKKDVIADSTSCAAINRITTHSYDEIIDLIDADLKNPAIKNIAVISRKKSHLIPYQIIMAGRGEKFYAAEDLNVMLNEAFGSIKDIIEIKRRQYDFPQQPKTSITNDILILCDKLLRFPLRQDDRSNLSKYMLNGSYDSFEGGVEYFLKIPNGTLGIKVSQYNSEIYRFMLADTVAEVINCLSNDFSGLKKDFTKADDDIFYADPPFYELADFAKRYGHDFAGFCEDVEHTITSLAQIVYEEEEIDNSDNSYITSKLHLMTALRTKGKEFDSVYILQSNNNIWPFKKAVELGYCEAERRLFYVVLTRARKKLTFLIDFKTDPSPYLKEIGYSL